MSEAHIDQRVARIMLGLLTVRRSLDPTSFDSLLGALQAEIQLGMDIAEEAALERSMGRNASGNVVRFPNGPGQQADDTAEAP